MLYPKIIEQVNFYPFSTDPWNNTSAIKIYDGAVIPGHTIWEINVFDRRTPYMINYIGSEITIY